MAARVEPAVLDHLEWIGFIRPTGLVVSATALVRAGAILERSDIEGQRLLRACVHERPRSVGGDPVSVLPSFAHFADEVLNWTFSPKWHAGVEGCPVPAELEVPLPEYGETLKPDFAVREPEPKEGGSPWQLLVRLLDLGEGFDDVVSGHGRLEASPHSRMERLLRETGVPAGLLFNGTALRLVSAPRGESSGWLDFKVDEMRQTGGRPLCTAMRLLLSEDRLLTLPRAERLAALLESSRKYQNEVSERLAEQVLHALYELLRGFQAAHDSSKGELLREVLAEHPDEVYRALLTVILRLVFLLFAEERDMLPKDDAFERHYSLAGLHQRLREDAALFPDTMEQRFGAWAQLLVLFRMIHDGASSGALQLPPRHGVLFDPDRYKFLEGRGGYGARQTTSRVEVPLVPDGTIYRALEKLLVLDGERISYRALDVEQIGSVYETMMGFRLEKAAGKTVAIKPHVARGAPTAVDIECLLSQPPGKRVRWIEEHAERDIPEVVRRALPDAVSLEDLHAALMPVIDLAATPDVVAGGAMVLQPSEERRRSGSHYTPRELTEPIVRRTLSPILSALRQSDGRPPLPAQILELKVCDPAMGSGAFLVESCRQLGDALVEAWRAHSEVPKIPPDEDELIFAYRLIAQRCLYGVDKNPVAVDLARVSLWLVTLARQHPLTFVDHALRHGDSLMGLSLRQIQGLNWDAQMAVEGITVERDLAKVSELRQRIRDAGEEVADWVLQDMWDEAQSAIGRVRLFGDLVCAAFFDEATDQARRAARLKYAGEILRGEAEGYRGWLDDRKGAEPAFVPFHWEIEFPEVFDRDNGGFDAIVGNPPFMGNRLWKANLGQGFQSVAKAILETAPGKLDLSVVFHRRAVSLLRGEGAYGLLAQTNIAEGSSVPAGLGRIVQFGDIFFSRKGFVWPGAAHVVTAIVCFYKGRWTGAREADGQRCARIGPRLEPEEGPAREAKRLQSSMFAFEGVNNSCGLSFVLGSDDPWRERLAAEDESLLRPYVTGDDITSYALGSPKRWALDIGDRDLETLRAKWPVAHRFLLDVVRPTRTAEALASYAGLHSRWWQFWNHRADLFRRLRRQPECIVFSKVTKYPICMAAPASWIYTNKVLLVGWERADTLALCLSTHFRAWLQLRGGGSLGKTLTLSLTEGVATFPLPAKAVSGEGISAARHFNALAIDWCKRHECGLTDLMNALYARDEASLDLKDLGEALACVDREVTRAYGWETVREDELLQRLLDLNAVQAQGEALAGATTKPRGAKRLSAMAARDEGDLFS